MDRCARCGDILTPQGVPAIPGALCDGCYLEKPYSHRHAWEVTDPARARAMLEAPMLTDIGIPVPAGAVVTERGGWCWVCQIPLPAGGGEVVWDSLDQCQHAICPACAWQDRYRMLWPEITPWEAVGVAALCLPFRSAHRLARTGWTLTDVLGPALTVEVRADLQRAAAASEARSAARNAGQEPPTVTKDS